MAGSHLDSVVAGPGVNDNGSGSATILEVAEQISAQKIKPRNKVRFAWWGAEELNLLGSTHYVEDLATNNAEALKDIALYLNFDMVGSPNYVRFVYDGDNSKFGEDDGAAVGPAGSGAIEKEFADYFASQGLASEETPFSGRSDYGPFIAARHRLGWSLHRRRGREDRRAGRDLRRHGRRGVRRVLPRRVRRLRQRQPEGHRRDVRRGGARRRDVRLQHGVGHRQVDEGDEAEPAKASAVRGAELHPAHDEAPRR